MCFLQNDRMAVDMGIELRKKNVCVVSLWPGAVMTEIIDNQVKQGEKVTALSSLGAKTILYNMLPICLLSIQIQELDDFGTTTVETRVKPSNNGTKEPLFDSTV